MKLAMLSPEITPFAKTGGLADVVGTLSIALEQHGHELSLIMPAYRPVLQGPFAVEETGMQLAVPLGTRTVKASVLRTRSGQNVSVYLIRADPYFDRDFLYGTAYGDFADNAERFTFFSRAALEILRRHPVDVIHCHDWQAALGIVFLKAQGSRYPEVASAKTVLTAHNLGFQGIFHESNWPLLDLDRSYFSPLQLEFYGNINFLKGALVAADKITTVSPTYAQEIMSAEQGFGLQGILRQRAADLVGILNGVDYSEWNPETDPFIAQRYCESNFAGKSLCKEKLQASLGLPVEATVPLLGMISRLTSQKGVDLVQKIFDPLMEQRLQMVLLGSGEPRYESFFTNAAARFPEKFAVRTGFDEALAHQIEAAADIFLMPSLYEPCGLNQMFSLKYGTIPVVRDVGGLKDTVADHDAERGTGTGFVFHAYEPQALAATIERALRAFADRQAWTAMIHRAMRMDFSWNRSAQAYNTLYEQFLR
ncbi:MAG: glycogen synthase GlgA [Candidatus Binatia bacterium]